MAKVTELTTEEIACLLTGLNYLSMYDKQFSYIDYVGDLIKKLENSRVFIGGKENEKK